ncbi:alpha/beta hydrolase [Dyadobacter bucti]|uniref:alpha/beta hydrolase n=1 Tax=Dyadobacter bucti TaxID=2572203 RepID=UPI001107F992|nr:alpha/beta hydrolase [Dyadobacter bucti]
MNIQLYFEFEDAERKPIALIVNGVPAGLQTAYRNGHRVFSYKLSNYDQPRIDLILVSLEEPTNVNILAFKDSMSLSQQVFLQSKHHPSHVSFDLKQAGWYEKDQELPIENPREQRIRWTLPINPRGLNRFGGRRMPKKPTTGKPLLDRLEDLKIDFEFYDKQTKKADLLVAKAEEVKNTLVDVFYATDRARKNKNKGLITYENGRGDLVLGKCVVNVPGRRKKGEIPLPPWYLFGFFEDDNKHMLIKSVEELGAKDFFTGVQTKVAESPEKDAFVFLHGFNVSFHESILRTAQMAVDIGFRGASIVYSWPSIHKVSGYMADEATATGYSVDSVIQLIKDVRANTGAERVHLIAHSMGNRLLTEALKAMVLEGFTKEYLFNQIILAAPDIDAEVFVKHIAPKIAGAGKQLTLYTSLHDNALWLSEKLHGGHLRLGTAGEQLAVCAGIDTIDASDKSIGLLGHGYFTESRALIDDIHHAIRFNHSPEERNLRKRISGKLLYWDFN